MEMSGDGETEGEVLPDWLFDDEHSDSYFMPLNHLKYTEEPIVRRVYALGRTIAKILKEAKLLYWTSGGTTLGIVRHGGLIPWDDDLDICILEQVFMCNTVNVNCILSLG